VGTATRTQESRNEVGNCKEEYDEQESLQSSANVSRYPEALIAIGEGEMGGEEEAIGRLITRDGLERQQGELGMSHQRIC